MSENTKIQEPPKQPTAPEKPDIREKGAAVDGVEQTSERRLYFQLLVFGDCQDSNALISPLRENNMESVLYLDVNDPRGVGLLMIAEDPSDFVNQTRSVLLKEPFISLRQKTEMTMIGRTYSTGREPNLEDWLLRKPKRNALNPALPWAIWYPLRRKPEFSILPRQEQGKILMEHAVLGRSYGQAGYALDIRLACHGLDRGDNEFVIGLVGSELFPLSRLIQEMRKTQQTSRYIQSLGPFFVGRAYWQSPVKE